MKRGSTPKGFTIVETLIFLAVSSVILVSALVLVGGSQSKTQFNTAMNDVSEQITKVINNVANGYYPSQDEGCRVAPSGDKLEFIGTSELGESVNCVYLGRVIQFSNQDNFRVYSVAGARKSAGVLNTNMADSKATVLNGFEEIQLKNGIKIESITSIGETTPNYNSIGFFTSLGDTEPDGDGGTRLASGGLSTNYIAITNGMLSDENRTPGYIGGDFRNEYDANKNPQKGVRICFRSGTTDQFGIIDIGGENRSATISTTVQGSCS